MIYYLDTPVKPEYDKGEGTEDDREEKIGGWLRGEEDEEKR